MKKLLRVIMLTICCLFAIFTDIAANAQAGAGGKTCSRPLVLELTTTEHGGVDYQLSGKMYSGYPLDDLRRQLSGCPASRPLFVVIDSRVPIGQLSSAVAPKLQVDNTRYFIKYPTEEHLVIEIKLGEYLSKLP